jgi:TRAP-type C4-dicarboxylate transport system permease small subunit
MRVFILNYCIFLGILIIFSGLWWVTKLLSEESNLASAAMLIFIGIPLVCSWIIVLDHVRNQIQKNQAEPLSTNQNKK